MNYNEGENNPNYKHGETHTRLHNIWSGIKQRCLYPKHIEYKNYGRRGITVCDEWLEFTPFRDWSLSNGYAKNLTIDRKDNNGNYEPNNCKWVSLEKNAQKKRNNKLTLEIANEIRYLYTIKQYTMRKLAIKYGVHIMTISRIINNKYWKN